MGLGLVDGFREAIRVLLGLPADPGQPPDLMRLGLYRARVDVCANDGSTVDLTPDDKRISPEKNVPVRVGVPGLVAVVSPGAIVLLGWDGGDPSKAYCVPSWEAGATVTKLIVKATAVYIGDEAGAKALATKDDFDTHTHLPGAITAPVGGGTCTGNSGAPTAPAAGTTKLKAV
jgi:hypothetical protein